MPDLGLHVQRARDNEDFYRNRLDLREPIDRSWAVVVIFYAALHWVDAYFATKNQHPPEHKVRDQLVSMTTDLRPIARDYLDLSQRSRDARYRLRFFSEAEVRGLDATLVTISDHISKLLPP